MKPLFYIALLVALIVTAGCQPTPAPKPRPCPRPCPCPGPCPKPMEIQESQLVSDLSDMPLPPFDTTPVAVKSAKMPVSVEVPVEVIVSPLPIITPTTESNRRPYAPFFRRGRR